MTYATQQDLIERFGERELIELTDRSDPPAGALDPALAAKALADADETVNAYIGRRYDLPLAAVPAVLTRIAADLARYQLYAHAPTELVETNHKAALAFLRDVAKGEAVLDAAGAEPARDPSNVQIESSPKIFGREKLEGF